MRLDLRAKQGFTLIEISIVLVIIGLIVGGILVGRDLVAASYLRSQISQIANFNTASNTFRSKYGYLPGDFPDPDATRFGFYARGTVEGTGDGNGVMEGYYGGTSDPLGQGTGENTMFWVDLSTAKLVPGFTLARETGASYGTPVNSASSPSLSALIPPAAIGLGNYIYVYSYGNLNYFGLSNTLYIGSAAQIANTASLLPSQAYAIDAKMDDGMPKTGRVRAQYVGYGVFTLPPYGAPDTSYTCYNHIANTYSTLANPSNGQCTISFQFTN